MLALQRDRANATFMTKASGYAVYREINAMNEGIYIKKERKNSASGREGYLLRKHKGKGHH